MPYVLVYHQDKLRTIYAETIFFDPNFTINCNRHHTRSTQRCGYSQWQMAVTGLQELGVEVTPLK